MNKHLNVLGKTVMEFKDYDEILKYWFPYRKLIYDKRFERLRELVKIRIMFLKEVIKFVSNHNKFNFSTLDETSLVQLLINDGYKQFNKRLLDSPDFLPVNEMYKIHDEKESDTSFEYLFGIGLDKE